MRNESAVAVPEAASAAPPAAPTGYRQHPPYSRACLAPWSLQSLENGIIGLVDSTGRTMAHWLPGTERGVRLATIAPILEGAIEAWHEVQTLRAAESVDPIRLADAEERLRLIMGRAKDWLATARAPRRLQPAAAAGEAAKAKAARKDGGS